MMREKYGMSEEEYERAKMAAEQRRERVLNSNKYKRFLRHVKKQKDDKS